MVTPESAGHKLLDWQPLRILLAVFFFLYTWVVIRGLIPLPDEPPRINFWGVFCLTGGMVIAFHSLTSKYRLFLVSIWGFLPLAIWQLAKRIRFLQMMLEPHLIEQVTLYALYGMILVLISPPALRLFFKPAREFERPKGLLMGNGIQF